jgi:hypothetical protein
MSMNQAPKPNKGDGPEKMGRRGFLARASAGAVGVVVAGGMVAGVDKGMTKITDMDRKRQIDLEAKAGITTEEGKIVSVEEIQGTHGSPIKIAEISANGHSFKTLVPEHLEDLKVNDTLSYKRYPEDADGKIKAYNFNKK